MSRPPQELLHHRGLLVDAHPAPVPACNDDETLLRRAEANCVLAIQVRGLAVYKTCILPPAPRPQRGICVCMQPPHAQARQSRIGSAKGLTACRLLTFIYPHESVHESVHQQAVEGTEMEIIGHYASFQQNVASPGFAPGTNRFQQTLTAGYSSTELRGDHARLVLGCGYKR